MSVFDPDLVTKPIGVIVQRTFHPVGQGAFYTEVFQSDTRHRFVMVYDCGNETADIDMGVDLNTQIDSFKNSLGANPQIDLLFISHFHADHIKGIERLLTGVKVSMTVIPMLDWSTLMVTRLSNYLRYHSSDPALLLSVDRIILELYINQGGSERFGRVVMVSIRNSVQEMILEIYTKLKSTISL